MMNHNKKAKYRFAVSGTIYSLVESINHLAEKGYELDKLTTSGATNKDWQGIAIMKLVNEQTHTNHSDKHEQKTLHIADVNHNFSEKDILSFGNFIRDNYYGVGSPRLISYEPNKRPHGTIEDIYKSWLVENYR